MKDGICPKCEEREVHVFTGTGAELSIRLGAFSGASVIYYICANCGYVELFVENKADLPKIAAKYPKV
jgi:predicted nucleic-acid-binding Zn-ribbon protein